MSFEIVKADSLIEALTASLARTPAVGPCALADKVIEKHAERDDGPVRVVPAVEFLKRLRPPDPLIDGLIPRGALYAMTGPTGHAKTAVATTMQVCLATGRAFAGRSVERGRVLVLAGENPDDYGLRLLATAQAMRVPVADLHNVYVVPGSFDVGAARHAIETEVARIGDLHAVIVDTSAAYFGGDDENANVEMRQHASRLRALCDLPGRPACIVLAHPTKNATRDNLLPRGGGAFLAEIDGNLTCWREGSLVTLSWGGKLRGPGFEPVQFELLPQTLAIVDSRGRSVPSVAALPVNDDKAEALGDAALSDENILLAAMHRLPGASVAELASEAGFVQSEGHPLKSKVHRLLTGLAAQGLARKSRTGRWALTPKGRAETKELTP